MGGLDAVGIVIEIGMTHAATGHLDGHLASALYIEVERLLLQGLAGLPHQPTPAGNHRCAALMTPSSVSGLIKAPAPGARSSGLNISADRGGRPGAAAWRMVTTSFTSVFESLLRGFCMRIA